MINSRKRTRKSEQPVSKTTVDDPNIKQLVNLTVGNSVTIELGEGGYDKTCPDFHSSDVVYTVEETVVIDRDGNESKFILYLSSTDVLSVTGDVLKISVERGLTTSEKWDAATVRARSGTKFGNPVFHTPLPDVESVTVVESSDCCPECGRPTRHRPR